MSLPEGTQLFKDWIAVVGRSDLQIVHSLPGAVADMDDVAVLLGRFLGIPPVADLVFELKYATILRARILCPEFP